MTTEAHKDLVLGPATVPYGLGAGSKTSTILTDGETFYCGTEDCPYTAPKYSQVMAHRSTHGRARRRAREQAGRPPTTLDGRLSQLKMDLLLMAEKIESIEKDVQESSQSERSGSTAYQRVYRRAHKAEKALEDHQRTLAKLAGLA